MKKILIETEASFFFEFPQKQRMSAEEKKAYILHRLEKEYPAVDGRIVWDYCIFTFEKKKFALVSVAGKDLYEEMRVKFPSCLFTSEISVIASSKEFVSGHIFYMTSGQQVFYDINMHRPELLFISDSEKSPVCTPHSFTEQDIQRSRAVFNTAGRGKYLKAALAACAGTAALVLLMHSCFSAAQPEESERILPETAAEISEDEVRIFSSLSSFLGISRIFTENNSTIGHFSQDGQGHIVITAVTEKPSELLEKITASGLFQNVSVTSMQKAAGRKNFSCTFELTAEDLPAVSGVPEASVLEHMLQKIPALKNAETDINGFVLETDPEGLSRFFRQYANFETEERLMLKSLSIDSSGTGIIIKGGFAVPADATVQFASPEKEAFSSAVSAFLYKKTETKKLPAVPESELGSDSGSAVIGKIRNQDGSCTVYKKDREGKIIAERSK